MSEQRPEYITDAMEMIGKGYEHPAPAIEIEPPREVIVRRGEKTAIEEKAAFVKISTAFKDSGELKRIDETALKVWLFLALSINRATGRAHPGLRTIAEGTGLAINTVRGAIARLETYGLLTVYRDVTKYHIYEPTGYVSANKETVLVADTPAVTVSVDDTTVSDNDKTVSVDDETVSKLLILNQRTREPEKPDRKKSKSKTSIKGIDAAIAQDRAVTPEDIELSRGGEVEATLVRLDEGLRLNCPRTPEWQSLARWINRQGNLDGWLSWFKSDEFRVKTIPHLTPNKIKMSWPQAVREQPARRDPFEKLYEYLEEQEAVNEQA